LSDSRGRYTWYVSEVYFWRRTLEHISHLWLQIAGGLHLAGPELADRIKPTVTFLSNDLIPAPTYVLPMHCSGFAVKVALEAALGEGCVPAGAGHTVTINGVPDDNAVLRPPSIRSR
jgi:7,8-dihydropterin-6-yl-methyl-4-(beta-D-ribofuranosyl)aminobenzene 5'-phosphate synthase